MTHTKHRKRRERTMQQEAEQRMFNLPGYQELRRALAGPLPPDDAYWTVGRTGRAG